MTRGEVATPAVEGRERSSAGLLGSVERRIERVVAALYRVLAQNRVTRVPWAVIQTFSRAQGALLSGSMAFFTFLSLLPLLLIAGSLIGTLAVGNVDLRDGLAGAIERLVPGAEGGDLVGQLVRSRAAFGLVGVVTVVYAGSGFVGALTACLNRMWNVSTGRNPIGQKIVNLVVVLFLGIVLLGSAAATIWVAYLTRAVLGSHAAVARWADVFVSPLALVVVLVMLYTFLPARRLPWRAQVPGAIFATLGVEALKRAFAFWASHSAGVSALPRSVVSIVLLLVWMGFFAQIILYGAALNVVRDRRRRSLDIMPPVASVRSPADEPS